MAPSLKPRRTAGLAPLRAIEEDEPATTPIEPPAQSTLLRGGHREAPAAESSWDDLGDLDNEDVAERYDFTALLGEGGMGEVRLCVDSRIHRPVAMKVMRPQYATRQHDRARFVREVLAQAKLEHPSIVPVYDLGKEDDGTLYFTMRRVEGVTLDHVLRSMRTGRKEILREYTRHRLLTAFGSICQAVHYAHTRSVYHCDIKPTNVMLGSFGEVYLVDWGLAARPSLDGGLSHGGTPGYMAPEQVRNETVDARTDVYSLGVLLFELLTLEPLHGRHANEAQARTLTGATHLPSERAPGRDIAPELDAIFSKATALAPEDRYQSARDMYDDLDRYLSGDRDLALRKQMSQVHADAATDAARRARAGGPNALEERSEALRAVGRALAFDPENKYALRKLVELLTEPPSVTPPETEKDLRTARRAFQRSRARGGALGFAAWIVLLPIFLHLDMVTPVGFTANLVAWLSLAALMVFTARRPHADGYSPAYVPVLGSIAIALSSLVNGPLMTATFATVLSMGFTLAMKPANRFVPLAGGFLAVIVPWAAEQLSIIPAWLGAPHAQTKSALFIAVELICIFVACFFAMQLNGKLSEVQHRVLLSAWQLRQLLPKEATSPRARD